MHVYVCHDAYDKFDLMLAKLDAAACRVLQVDRPVINANAKVINVRR